MSVRPALLRLLADGQMRRGADLAAALGRPPAEVEAALTSLESSAHVVRAPDGASFALARPLDLLDADAIRSRLAPAGLDRGVAVEVRNSVDSTNRHLLERPAEPGRMVALLAEEQTAGRGRRGRVWYSPYGGNVYLSVRRDFSPPPAAFGALSLATAVAVADALDVAGIEVKWPNDLQVGGRKLGGILVEATWPGPRRVGAVVGVGINVGMPGAGPAPIDQPHTDLAGLLGRRPDRNALAADLIIALAGMLERFAADGFEPFRDRYLALETLTGHAIRFESDGAQVIGEALGIDADGALLVRTDAGVTSVNAGDASRLRATA